MPPAVATAVGLGLAGMVDQNVQNKAAIKNSENATTSANAQVQQNQANAQGNLSKYVAANPGPAQPGGISQPPAYAGANVPMAGTSPSGGGAIPPQVVALLQQLKQSGMPIA